MERALDLRQDIVLLLFLFFFTKNRVRWSTLRTCRGNPFRMLHKFYEIDPDILKLEKDGSVSKLDFFS